jgi:hypothetical protein
VVDLRSKCEVSFASAPLKPLRSLPRPKLDADLWSYLQ